MLRRPKGFEERLGRDALNAFCRCCVHANRLNGIVSCMYTSEQFHGRDSVAFWRDQDTLLWFGIGTLRELARAIQRLRTALAERQLLDHASKPWRPLNELEKRWRNDAFLRKMRDRGAFHVDEETVERGLDELLEEPHVSLVKGQGRRDVDSWLTLGVLALHNGLGMDRERYGEFLEVVMADLSAAVPAIEKSFILASKAVDVPLRDR